MSSWEVCENSHLDVRIRAQRVDVADWKILRSVGRDLQCVSGAVMRDLGVVKATWWTVILVLLFGRFTAVFSFKAASALLRVFKLAIARRTSGLSGRGGIR
jgi:hypothetical protein